jgi:hypothetical protein
MKKWIEGLVNPIKNVVHEGAVENEKFERITMCEKVAGEMLDQFAEYENVIRAQNNLVPKDIHDKTKGWEGTEEAKREAYLTLNSPQMEETRERLLSIIKELNEKKIVDNLIERIKIMYKHNPDLSSFGVFDNIEGLEEFNKNTGEGLNGDSLKGKVNGAGLSL